MPPKDLFEQQTTAEVTVMREPQPVYMLDPEKGIQYPETGGIFVYLQGMPYPRKGFPTPQAIVACNTVKRYLMTEVRFFRENLYIFIPLIFLPYRYKLRAAESWLRGIRMFAKSVMTPHYYIDRYLGQCPKEIKKFITLFLMNLGIREYFAEGFARLFAHLIEYDTAYRYRIEDILSETTANKLIVQPRREIQRLMAIFTQREWSKATARKFEAYARIISLILLHPRIKKAFTDAVRKTNVTMLQLDEADRYHVLQLGKYDFFGRNVEERRQEYLALHNGNPPQPMYINVQY